MLPFDLQHVVDAPQDAAIKAFVESGVKKISMRGSVSGLKPSKVSSRSE
jgi:hypothetical protein